MTDLRPNRRRALQSLAAAVSAAALPRPAVAQGAGPHIVVVGGGFGGASCARALKAGAPNLSVTLVETNPVYFAPPMSNAAIAGLTDLKQQQFGYDAIARAGVTIAISAATAIDPQKRSVALANGTSLRYERLVVSPGIDFRWNAIQGYSEAAAEVFPHAFQGAAQAALLRKQLEAMDDGGLVVISAPVNPARCPPAPYERASLIAHYLKAKKPRSKIVLLDAKDSFSLQRLFEDAWKALYPDMIEWVPISKSGTLASVNVETRTLSTDFDDFKATVANVIPPQKAGRIAEMAGVVDRTGWCPVDPVSFASKLQPDVHVIGDAAIAGAIPRSASAAVSQGKICAAAIIAAVAGKSQSSPALSSACYSLCAPDYAISQRGTYHPVGDQYEPQGTPAVSEISAPASVRRREADEAQAWYKDITTEVFA